jgi:hypothetical protein
MKEMKHETFRSGRMSFEKDFAGYLIGNRKNNWKASKCTFFRAGDNTKSWAVCSFERYS